MSGLKALACGLLAVVTLLHAAWSAQAAGALVIGQCAAYGYAYDYSSLAAARDAARKKCDGTCTTVVPTRKTCAAFAVDGHKPCGPLGYASARQLGEAQNTALRHCHKHGGRDCMVRAWICDGRG